MANEKDSIYTAFQLLWRKLPGHLVIPGPFPLIYADVDSSELPTIDPGDKPWGRLVVQEQSSSATNIRQTRWRVSGMATLQIFARRTTTNSADKARRCADYFTANFLEQTRRDNVVYVNMRTPNMPIENGYSRVDFAINWRWDEIRQRSA